MNELLLIERKSLFAETESLHNDALAETPAVRDLAVARGKALIANPDYPSKEQIAKIAVLLAEKLPPAVSSSSRSGRSVTLKVLSLAPTGV